MKKHSSKNSRRGATFAEVIVAAAVLGVLSGALITALTQYNSRRNRIVTLGSKDIQIAGLVENVRANLQFFQAHYEVYNRSRAVNAIDRIMPDVDSLPLVWSANGAIATPTQCPTCEGKLGMLIQPFPTDFNASIFLITLRLSHPELNSGRPTDYRFLSTFKD
jgi:hypothetical protein